MTVSDEILELMAKSYVDAFGGIDWDALPESLRRKHLRGASAALNASGLIEQVQEKNGALKQAEEWFRDYEAQHRAKNTYEATKKADTNRYRAEMMRAAQLDYMEAPDHV